MSMYVVKFGFVRWGYNFGIKFCPSGASIVDEIQVQFDSNLP